MRVESVALKPKMHAIKLLGKELELDLIGWDWSTMITLGT